MHLHQELGPKLSMAVVVIKNLGLKTGKRKSFIELVVGSHTV